MNPTFVTPNTMRYFLFGGVASRQYFQTTDMNRSILPPVEVDTISIPQRAGAYSVRSTLGIRSFTIGVRMIANTYEDLRLYMRNIATWLYRDQDTPLIFSDEPDKYYLARLSGDTDLTEIARMGEGSLTFIATDPFAYSNHEKNQLLSDFVNGSLFANLGTYECYPRIRLVPTGTISYIRLSLGTKYIYVTGPFLANQPVIIDMNTNSVYMEVTGERIMRKVTISSDFFAFQVGDNLLRAEPNTGLSLRVYWRERFL